MGAGSLHQAASVVVVALAIIVAVLTQSFDPALQKGFTRIPTPDISRFPLKTEDFSRKVINFHSNGVKCEGWKYTPVKSHPKYEDTLVVLGHGIGCQRDFGLERYAEGYAKAGIASLSFDYRNFGGSDGDPRNLIAPTRHVEDWIAAVEYARASGYKNIVAHGTSYGGGHVLVAASKQMNVSCVISQVPFVGGPESTKKNIVARGVTGVLRILHTYLKDSLHGLLGWDAVGMKIAADKSAGEFGYMELDPWELQKYYSKHPKTRLGGWENMSPGRGLLDVFLYKPIKHVSQIQVPTLIVALKDDSLCNVKDIELTAEKCGKACTVVARDGDHFAIYEPEHFGPLMNQYIDFLSQHL